MQDLTDNREEAQGEVVAHMQFHVGALQSWRLGNQRKIAERPEVVGTGREEKLTIVQKISQGSSTGGSPIPST